MFTDPVCCHFDSLGMFMLNQTTDKKHLADPKGAHNCSHLKAWSSLRVAAPNGSLLKDGDDTPGRPVLRDFRMGDTVSL